MASLSKFVVLIERRTVLLGLASLARVAVALFPRTALAQATDKVSADLQQVIDASTTP